MRVCGMVPGPGPRLRPRRPRSLPAAAPASDNPPAPEPETPDGRHPPVLLVPPLHIPNRLLYHTVYPCRLQRTFLNMIVFLNKKMEVFRKVPPLSSKPPKILKQIFHLTGLVIDDRVWGMNYYNEIEPYAAEWLRNLIKAGEIAPGDVDERDIRDVTPAELVGYTQCHFFAGIGGWSRALRLAGWPDDRPVWTGSCPCQSFSAAGQGKGFADERHLWPSWFHLIRVCKPPVIFGEQVASKLALSWLDLVFDDLEAEGYSCGAADLCAAGVGAPHIRQRLWFVASLGQDTSRFRRGRWGDGDKAGEQGALQTEGLCPTGLVANSHECPNLRGEPRPKFGAVSEEDGGMRTVADADRGRQSSKGLLRSISEKTGGSGQEYFLGDESTGNFWSSCEWLPCRDGKWRPTQPGIQPLAHGVPARVGKLRAAGNAIVPEIAMEFVKVFLDKHIPRLYGKRHKEVGYDVGLGKRNG